MIKVVLICFGPILVIGQTVLSITDQTGKLTSRDTTYSYLDTLVNDCLRKIDTCDNGEIFVFNLTVSYQNIIDETSDTSSNYGRTVLFSSGGDSPYTPGGVFLHQFAIRGENYIELGITYQSQIYSIKVCLLSLNFEFYYSH